MSDDTRPSTKTLRALAGMLPSMAKGIAEGKIGGKGIKVDQVPRKVCNICGASFDFSSGPKEEAILTESCERCQVQLKDGYTAFISESEAGKRFAFAKAESLSDMAGKIVSISPVVMEKLAEQFKAEWQEIARPGVDGHPNEGWTPRIVEPPSDEPKI